MRSPAQMLILIRLPPKGYFLFILGILAVSCKEMEFEYGIKITRKKNVKSKNLNNKKSGFHIHNNFMICITGSGLLIFQNNLQKCP